MKQKKGDNAKEVEEKWREYWEKNNIYKFDVNSKKEIYSIDTPPPTVSGKMHIGHAFSYAQEDFIARYRRMKGFNVFYPFGTDDNGLPTERLVERLKKVKSKNMSREAFIKLCLKTLNEIRDGFIQDWKNIGVSCDYNIFYSTIDEHSRKISQESFIELYKKNLIYTDEFPTIWCPECQTGIAQAELEDKQESSLFSTILFDKKLNVKIATTRPELIPSCVGIFIHPNDKRYKNLIDKKIKVPIFGQEVKIIADKSADMEKGTGILMICSYGDKYDVDAIKRKKLSQRVVLTKDGKLNKLAGKFSGLTINQGRERILDEFKKQNLIVDEKKISHVVNTHDKCGTAIEFLPVKQWFVKLLDKKKKFIEQGKKIKWKPEFMKKRYENWVNGLEWDWSISRERHFGIPIPVWYCCNKIILADEKKLPVDPISMNKKCPKCGKNAIGEKLVLDTWMTSSLTPQIAASLVKNIKLPYDLRPQGHDIIRTWAFYTIIKALYHENRIPWENIMVSGFVTLQGEKMSKSKGNVVEPQSVIEKHGADALRFWAASSKLGEDLDYREEDLLNAKKLINKISNAARFVFMNLKNYKLRKIKLLEIDKLFLSKLNKTIISATKYFEEYEYSKVKQEVEGFFWREFCDNYLEIIKNRVYNGNETERNSAFYTLYVSLLSIIKMFSPIMPFMTEELFQEYFKNEKEKSIHISGWPKVINLGKCRDKNYDLFLQILHKVRKKKSEKGKSVKAEIILYLDKKDKGKLKEMLGDLASVCNSEIKEGKFKVEFK